jgi:hypothetical protein
MTAVVTVIVTVIVIQSVIINFSIVNGLAACLCYASGLAIILTTTTTTTTTAGSGLSNSAMVPLSIVFRTKIVLRMISSGPLIPALFPAEIVTVPISLVKTTVSPFFF